jgi:hypothetical protein
MAKPIRMANVNSKSISFASFFTFSICAYVGDDDDGISLVEPVAAGANSILISWPIAFRVSWKLLEKIFQMLSNIFKSSL